MLQIQRKISKYNHYKSNDIKYIVIHYVGANSTAQNNAIYFNTGDRQASAHYFVDDTSIWQVVEDFNGAWHIGNTKTEVNNRNSIGIEMCLVNGQVTAKTEYETIELVKYLMKKYNIPVKNVRTHAEVTKYTKICPNWADNNWYRWRKFKEKLNENTEGDGYFMKVYKNGSTREDVFSDMNCTQKIGSLDPYETCTCIYETKDRAIVIYKVNGASNQRTGWVRWVGGIQK